MIVQLPEFGNMITIINGSDATAELGAGGAGYVIRLGIAMLLEDFIADMQDVGGFEDGILD